MKIADLYSCAGLGADGYAAVLGAGSVHGYDIDPQPDYPYTFTQADALDLLKDRDGPLARFSARHTSPPCQDFTTAGHLRTAQGGTSRFGDLLTPTLALLRWNWNSQPWVVENVDDNQKKVRQIMEPRPGEHRIILCGTMFGLPIWRHRIFLANFPLRQPEPTGPGVYGALGCRHDICPPDPVTGRPRPWGVYHVEGDSVPSGGRTALNAEHAREVMGVHRSLPWASLKEGFPPAYTSWVAADLLRAVS
jgi:DNA (cytosine-5)-methyltransferase 1